MKFGAKLACVVLCALFVGGSCGCGKAVPESPYQSVGDVILALKEAGLPVTNEIVYQEETDVTPAYRQKGDFSDSRLEPRYTPNPDNGTVEIFSSPEKMRERAEEQVGYRFLSGYGYQIKTGIVLVQLDKQFTIEQAEGYAEALEADLTVL
ncbi:hypothetical protein [Massilioclostridium coli]|uniref:hypothetical protein n=1 Tax=Massilioclostridium coli TaxID=1870991 RepID=UPI0022E7AA61|nr:hypothetical protein [Massilioclostridium coli]